MPIVVAEEGLTGTTLDKVARRMGVDSGLLVHYFSGTTLQPIRGRKVEVKTGGGRKVVRFSFPMGNLPAYYTGHAESVSLPRNLKGLSGGLISTSPTRARPPGGSGSIPTGDHAARVKIFFDERGLN